MLKRILVPALIAGLALPALAAAPASTYAVERAIRATSGSTADFVQKFTPRGFTRAQVERGEVLFGAPPRMRWSYATPEKKLFLFDGTTSWLYAPADRQVTVSRLTDEDRRRLPFLLLADGKALRAEYDVRETRQGETVVSRLEPRSGVGSVRDLTVVTGVADDRIRRIEYADAQGNRTVFEFARYRAAKVTDQSFRFEAPKGVQVIRQ